MNRTFTKAVIEDAALARLATLLDMRLPKLICGKLRVKETERVIKETTV